MFINTCKTPYAKELIIQFFQLVEYLENNIDTITYEEYKTKSDKMWGLRNEVMEIEGTILIIDLFSLGEKADKRFGKDNIESL